MALWGWKCGWCRYATQLTSEMQQHNRDEHNGVAWFDGVASKPSTQ